MRPDLEPDKGPLGGLLTALVWAKERKQLGVFLLGCDMPFVSVQLIELLLSKIDGSAAVVPVGRAGLEPLCGFLSFVLLSDSEGTFGFSGQVDACPIKIDRSQRNSVSQ